MFDELEAYKNHDHFFLNRDQSLAETCNAPKDIAGVYVVYRLANGGIDLVYIGSSGKITNNGKLKIRKGGLYDRIVSGKQFGEPRQISWSKKMENDDIDALDIYWYETFNKITKDIPAFTEAIILQRYFDIHETLPSWNKEF